MNMRHLGLIDTFSEEAYPFRLSTSFNPSDPEAQKAARDRMREAIDKAGIEDYKLLKKPGRMMLHFHTEADCLAVGAILSNNYAGMNLILAAAAATPPPKQHRRTTLRPV